MAVGGKVVLVALLCLMVANAAEGAMTCPVVISSVSPCIRYLTNGGPVPPSCCTGISQLYKATSTTGDRQIACRCLEKTASMLPGIHLDAARTLPKDCGVNIPYVISPKTDCSKVQ